MAAGARQRHWGLWATPGRVAASGGPREVTYTLLCDLYGSQRPRGVRCSESCRGMLTCGVAGPLRVVLKSGMVHAMRASRYAVSRQDTWGGMTVRGLRRPSGPLF
jgi:hypothetical protein